MKNKFNDYPQREYDFETLEQNLLAREATPRRYSFDNAGNAQRLWNGKTVEQFNQYDTVKFFVDNEIFLKGELSESTKKLISENGYDYKDGKLIQREENTTKKCEQKASFYGMITYSSRLNAEDNLVAFYDDKKEFDAEMAHQKRKRTQNYGTVLSREQFIEHIGTALETSGHQIAIGRALEGDYTQEVANWRANHTGKQSVYPKLIELNEKAEIVFGWEQSNKIEKKDCTTTTDGHTGQILIVSDKKFEERYEQIMSKVIEHTQTNVPQKTKEYLSLPRLEKGEFENLTKQLKDEGARFDPEKKQWYITQEADQEKIEGLVQSVREGHQEGKEYLSLPRLEKGEFENLTKQLKTEGAKFDPEKKQWYITLEMDKEKFDNMLQAATQEHQKLNSEVTIPGVKDEYSLSIGMTADDNRCMVYFKDGAAVLDGQDYGVNFATLPMEKVKGIVEREYESKKLNLQPELSVEQILQEAKAELTASEYELFVKEDYNYTQMQAIWDGIREGYTASQIATYADVQLEAWQMDIMRSAAYYSINKDTLLAADALEPLTAGVDLKVRYDRLEKLAEEKRCCLAKTIQQSGFTADRHLVNQVLAVNHITHKEHTVADMATAYKEGTYSNGKAADLITKIGKEFSRQEHLREIVR